MGQAANEKRTAANEARAMAKYLRTSPYKLNLVAQMIRGKDAGRALVDLEFSSKRIAKDVRKVLQSAVANAENNHGLDVDKLYVAEAHVGKAIMMKRFSPRARGRAARIEKHFSRLTVVVKERGGEAAVAKPVKKAEAKKQAPAKGKAKTDKAAPKEKAVEKKSQAKASSAPKKAKKAESKTKEEKA